MARLLVGRLLCRLLSLLRGYGSNRATWCALRSIAVNHITDVGVIKIADVLPRAPLTYLE